MAEPNKKKNDINNVVKTRIKGLGLDALFHQVDVTKKDDDDLRLQVGPDSIELGQLIEKLKKNFHHRQPEEAMQEKNKLWSGLFAPKAEVCVGLLLGPSAIKLIEIKKLNDNNLLSRAHYIPIPHIVTSNPERLEQFVVETVEQSFDLHLLRQTAIFTIIPRSEVMVKFLTLPTQELAEVKKMIEFEVEQLLPLALNELEMDYHIIKCENNLTQVVVAAIKKEDLNKRINIFRKLNLSPDAVEISSLALVSAMSSITPGSGITLQVNIGSEHTDLNICKEHELIYTRGLPWGSKGLTHKLADSLNVSFDNAEKIKKENGILLLKKAEHEIKRKISQQACLWTDELIEEIKRTWQHFQLEKGYTKIDRIILTGGGSKLTHLTEYIKDKLKTKTLNLKVNDDIQIGGNPDIYHHYFSELSLILGVTLRGFQYEKDKIGINLLPSSLKHAVSFKKQRFVKIKIIASLLLLGMSLLFLPMGILKVREKLIDYQKKRIAELEQQVAVVKVLKNEIQTIEDYISTKHSCMALLREVSLVVTMDITIDSIMFENNESITLIGEAESHASVVNLSRRLQESEHIKNANIRYTRKTHRESNNVEFEINCTLNKD